MDAEQCRSAATVWLVSEQTRANVALGATICAAQASEQIANQRQLCRANYKGISGNTDGLAFY
jgi:hypothetical protein